MVRSANWQPYPLDGLTIRLYHLDELERPVEARAPGEKGNGNADLLGAPGTPVGPGGQASEREVRGANRGSGMGPLGQLAGNSELVKAGRFGGGILLKGGDGALICPNVDWGVGRMLELWVRLEAIPKQFASLGDLKTTQNDTYSLSFGVNADGSLAAMWNGKRLQPTKEKLKTGEWTHVAMQWGYAHGALTVSLLINSRIVGTGKEPYDWSQHCSTRRQGVLILGNDSSGARGVQGTVDEVRLSEGFRQYYMPDLAWVDPDAGPRAKEEQPHFRDPEDLLFHLTFNETLKPERCAKGTEVSSAVEPDIGDEARYYSSGIEGRGLLLGHGGLGPVYEGKGNTDTKSGTAAFWLRPVDWDNYTRDNRFDAIYPVFLDVFHTLGDFPTGGAPERWRSVVPLERFILYQTRPEFAHYPLDFNPGRWVHLAVTWEKEKVRYYADGKPWAHFGSIRLVTCDNDYWIWGKPGRPSGTAWTHKSEAHSIRFQKIGRSIWHPYWHPGRKDPHTVIDDFRIYRRALSPTEVWNLAALHDQRKELKKLPPVEMSVAHNGVIAWVEVEAFPLVPDYAELEAVTLSVTKEGEATPVASETLEVTAQAPPKARLTAPPLGFGTYVVKAAFNDAEGKVKAQGTETFTRTKPPWWGTDAGRSDKVMPDWEPVRVKGSTVSVVLRDITFAASGLPEKIISVGEDILAGPVTLIASQQGKAIPLSPPADAPKVVSSKETHVTLEGGLAAHDWRLETQVTVEFDGMMWFRATLAPEQGRSPTLDRLVLRIPYTSGSAQLTHWWSGGEPGVEDNTNFPELQFHLGSLPKGKGAVLRSNDTEAVRLHPQQRGSFMPYVMLGGMKRGMAWFATNDKGWTQSMEVPAVSIVREDDTVALVLNVISSEVRIEDPRTFEFGLHPTPVKKLAPNWRMWPGTGVRPDFGGTFRGGPTAWDSLLPENEDWDGVTRLWEDGEDEGVRRMKERGADGLEAFRERYGRDPEPREQVALAIYTCLPSPGAVPEHTREWSEQWLEHHRYPYRSRVVITQGFLDFASWCWDQWFAHGLIKGIYVDGVNLRPQWHDTGLYAYTLPDGHVQPGFQIRGVREYTKRMRQASWDHGVVPHICCHMTNQIFIPQLSFVDVMFDGEDKYSSPGKPTDFLDHWPPDRMRVNHVGKWGVMPKWLGWHVQTPRKDGSLAAWEYRQNRAWIANLALHDIQWQFGGPYSEGGGAAFGLREKDTVCVPYWDLQGVAEVIRVKRARAGKKRADDEEDVEDEEGPQDTPPLGGPGGTGPVYITAWKRPGKCLVLLVNWSDERFEADVKFDRQAMGLGAGPAPEAVVEDVDTYLIPPATVDFLTLKTPEMTGKEALLEGAGDEGEPVDEEALDEEFKEEEDEDLTPQERRARHPDAQFTWKDGILRCPIRRHDFRLFVFSVGGR